jgi:hypothetical protein
VAKIHGKARPPLIATKYRSERSGMGRAHHHTEPRRCTSRDKGNRNLDPMAGALLDAAATEARSQARGAHGAMPTGNRPRQSPASLDHLVQILSLDYLVEQQVTRVPDVPVDVSLG